MILSGRFVQFFVVFFVALAMVGCKPPPTFDVIEGEVDQSKSTLDEHENREYTRPAPVLTQTGAYVDIKKVSLQRAPSWLKQQITVHGNGLPLSFYTGELLENTGALVHYDTSVDRKQLISMDYRGTLRGALDNLATTSDLAYDIDYKKNMLTWSAFVTKTFDISFVPGASSFTLGGTLTAGSSSSSDSDTQSGYDVTSDSQNSQLIGTPSVWDDMQATIRNLMSADGKANVSQSSTTITLKDHPSNVHAISDYIEKINQELTKQVRVQVRILEVNLNKGFEFGINWNIVNQSSRKFLNFTSNAFDNVSQSSVSPQSLEINILSGGWQGTDTFIKAIQEQGKVSVLSQPVLVTLNNQTGQVIIQDQQNYISSIDGYLNEGGSSSSTETGTVSTGLNLYVLPKIRENDIILQINGTLSALVSLEKFNLSTGEISDNTSGSDPSGSSGPNFVQLPNVSLQNINQRAIIKNGETLIIAGFKSLNNTANREKVLFSQALGSKAANATNSEVIFLITPTILSAHEKLLEDLG